MPHTLFKADRDGFAFLNYWTFDPAEVQAICGAFVQATTGAASVLDPFFGLLLLGGLNQKLKAAALKALPASYGLCGGMAFASLDYYNAGLECPTCRTAPSRANADGTTMRNYLEKRQLDSLRDNLARVLAWMAVLNWIPQWWSFESGAPWLLSQSRGEWNRLKQSIDEGNPQPLALIGATADPSHNHQVLAIGYEEAGDGTGVLDVYDMNCPGAEQSIQLDFRGPVLQAVESCPSADRGPLRGFICEKYFPSIPPQVGDWTV